MTLKPGPEAREDLPLFIDDDGFEPLIPQRAAAAGRPRGEHHTGGLQAGVVCAERAAAR